MSPRWASDVSAADVCSGLSGRLCSAGLREAGDDRPAPEHTRFQRGSDPSSKHPPQGCRGIRRHRCATGGGSGRGRRRVENLGSLELGVEGAAKLLDSHFLLLLLLLLLACSLPWPSLPGSPPQPQPEQKGIRSSSPSSSPRPSVPECESRCHGGTGCRDRYRPDPSAKG
eukprot:763006-Hanusia_phi.AAC.7